jgi:predicted naringenin-chalcone synthase
MDAALIRQLELAPNVTRIPLTFIGCAAGLKAICLTKQLLMGNPDAKALVVCVELCTLHIQPAGDRDSLFGASFFGDGASACVVGEPREPRQSVFYLGDAHSALLAEGADEMVWEVGNYGFDLYLSPTIPRLIGEAIPPEVRRLIGDGQPESGQEPEPVQELWAIHPGGKGIIEVLQQQYGLTDGQVAPSLDVLREIGNVSSATILFVLQKMKARLDEEGSEGADGIALAFGPGLTAEMIKIAYAPSAIRKPQPADNAYA